MISIQEFGTEIMHKTPRKYYAFCGVEYGVKMKYLEIIASMYQGRIAEYESADKVIKFLTLKHMIPLQPTLYIIRYDEQFIKDIDKQVHSLNSIDDNCTVVFIYDSDTAERRCEKYIPENTVVFDPVDRKFVKRYLMKDYDGVPENVIDRVINVTSDYISANSICKSISVMDNSDIVCMTEDDIRKTFCASQSVNIENIKYGIAARDARYCLNIISQYDGTADSIVYAALNALLEIEKCMVYKKINSYAVKYIKVWNFNDVNMMFNNLYTVLIQSRSAGSFDLREAVECVIGSMSFSPIPKFL